MGGCANSKYAVDEDKHDKKPLTKKDKKTKKPDKNGHTTTSPTEAQVKIQITEPENSKSSTTITNPNPNNDLDSPVGSTPKKFPVENIEFIDRDEAMRQQAAAAIAAAQNEQRDSDRTRKTEENDDEKREVTTYQTTVVKHSQKQGDELLQHLKNEAFRSLQSSLRSKKSSNTTTTTTSASVSDSPPTTNSDADETPEAIIQKIKTQVLESLGSKNEDQIRTIIDSGCALITENKVKSMLELQTELEKTQDAELVKRVINATTGYLTAKGTEAGAILSNILANTSQGIQGVMNETEKTTVKVTRTVTEQIMSGGQLKEITRIITQNVDPTEDMLKNINFGSSVVRTEGTSTLTETTSSDETHENCEAQTKATAEKVVNTAVNAAVEIVGHENSTTQESVKIEEESKVTSTLTKIILNQSEESQQDDEGLGQVQKDFYKNGKSVAEELIKTITSAAADADEQVQLPESTSDKKNLSSIITVE